MPGYYHSLPPFRELFQTGVPILTYHKLGPCPRGARLKGLYMSAKLFDRQLAELRAAGFASAPLTDAARAAGNQLLRLGITFDDGFANVLRYGLNPLAQHGFQAVQFLVSDRLGGSNEWDRDSQEVQEPLMDASQVRDWLAAGHLIGSHTQTHPWLTRLPLDQSRAEIRASKLRLEDRFGLAIEHFCYPYGDWNERVRDLVAEAGYLTACTTDPGVNSSALSPFLLRRFTARYPSRNLKALWQRFRRWRTA